jgi:hypothetical protein
MRRPHVLILAAWLLQVTAWFLPAAEVFGLELPGWDAFWVTLGSVLPSWDAGSTWYGLVLAGISVIATLLFILGSPWVVLRGSRSLRRTSAWAAGAAFVFNAHWWALGDLGWRGLKIGYFLWWFSFAVIALGLFDLARQSRVTPESSAVS